MCDLPRATGSPEVAFNNDCTTGTTDKTSCLTFAATANKMYAVQVDGFHATDVGFVSVTVL